MNKSPKVSVATVVLCVLGAAGALSISSCDTINQILGDGGAVEDAGGGFDTGSGPCGTCVKDKCTATSAACSADGDCSRLWNCIGACGGDYYCQQICEKQHPGGFGIFFSFITCLHDSCPASCFSGTAVADGGTVEDAGIPFDAGVDAGRDAGTPEDTGVDGGTCAPDCAGKVCGYLDGCDGRCTGCESTEMACNTSTWKCEKIVWPSCEECAAHTCGPEFDICTSNEECALLYNCVQGCTYDLCVEQCVAGHPGGKADYEAYMACYRARFDDECYDLCKPDCTGRLCGDDDGRGGKCLGCENAGQTCDMVSWTCKLCEVDCTSKVCGEVDGCGGRCTRCADTDKACNKNTWTCVPCTPDCDGKECGDDGCGRPCLDRCARPATCEGGGVPYTCGCIPVCLEKFCGQSDGCGGMCGGCYNPAYVCNQSFWACEPESFGSCEDCVLFHCLEEYYSCEANDECVQAGLCVEGCTDNPCAQQCLLDHNSGERDFTRYWFCFSDRCRDECLAP